MLCVWELQYGSNGPTKTSNITKPKLSILANFLRAFTCKHLQGSCKYRDELLVPSIMEFQHSSCGGSAARWSTLPFQNQQTCKSNPRLLIHSSSLRLGELSLYCEGSPTLVPYAKPFAYVVKSRGGASGLSIIVRWNLTWQTLFKIVKRSPRGTYSITILKFPPWEV